MIKELRTTGLKQHVLSLLQEYAGNIDGIDAQAFIQGAAQSTGLHPSTITKMLHEQIGQVWMDGGRIFVVHDAQLTSLTSRAPSRRTLKLGKVFNIHRSPRGG